MKILYILLILFLITCSKEYSGEGAPVAVDSIPNPIDTIPIVDTPKNYFVNYDIYVPDNLKISHIEVQAKIKPDTSFIGYASIIHVDDSATWRYKEAFDVGWLLESTPKGDSAIFGYVIVYPGPIFTNTFITDTIVK